jgi:hypothetical protein
LAECEEIILEQECGICPEGDCDCEPESCL